MWQVECTVSDMQSPTKSPSVDRNGGIGRKLFTEERENGCQFCLAIISNFSACEDFISSEIKLSHLVNDENRL